MAVATNCERELTKDELDEIVFNCMNAERFFGWNESDTSGHPPMPTNWRLADYFDDSTEAMRCYFLVLTADNGHLLVGITGSGKANILGKWST